VLFDLITSLLQIEYTPIKLDTTRVRIVEYTR